MTYTERFPIKITIAEKVIIQHALAEYLRALKGGEGRPLAYKPEVVEELLERLKDNR